MRRVLLGLVGICAAWLVALTALAAPTTLIYPRSESASDSQYVYDYELLRQALAATVASHGPYELRQSTAPMNQARAADEIAAGSGLVNVFARSTTIEWE